MNNVLEVLEEVELLYGNLLNEGYTKDAAQAICRDYQREHEEKAKIKNHITLRRQLPLNEIENLNYVKEKKGFKNLTVEEKDSLVWALGIDSKGFRYTTDIGYYTFHDRRFFGEFIVGQERSDKEWTTKLVNELHVCSYEAILKRKGHFKLMAEITRELSGRNV